MNVDKITLSAHLQTLNEEWWVCNLRRKVYPAIESDLYNATCNQKRDEIKTTAKLLNEESIFSSKDLMKQANRRFARHGGMPQYAGRTELDIEYYYTAGTRVRCFYGFKEDKPIIEEGVVIYFDSKTRLVSVSFEKNVVDELPIKDVTRIF